ncbi:MAG: tRNA (adenosine(37)-N6)-threonylcarbamoyltransferase complex ATPase subunit type 1 TsaE [Legionellaceae bacterium]|nr:tRNA (adenosine(37)-N6)-threonylcarbamoyltransferase complex ATPase subunit type 1 TsaE [Legionellaceae bacterium]
MTDIAIPLSDESASVRFAQQLAPLLQAPLVLGWSGQLGAGKTTMIRALLRALDVQGPIKSPTYALVETYDCPSFFLHHFDLYRIAEEEELEYIGFRDFFTEDSICCIEWPDNTRLSSEILDVRLELSLAGDGRALIVKAYSPRGEQVLKDWGLR